MSTVHEIHYFIEINELIRSMDETRHEWNCMTDEKLLRQLDGSIRAFGQMIFRSSDSVRKRYIQFHLFKSIFLCMCSLVMSPDLKL